MSMRRESVILALGLILKQAEKPLGTLEVAIAIQELLEWPASERRSIGRILADIAPQIPEAVRGDTFMKYGRAMQRWIWWPKGSTPSGSTRSARRLDAAQLAALPRVTAADEAAYVAAVREAAGLPLASDDIDASPDVWGV